MIELRGTGFRSEEDDDVVQWQRTDEVEEKESLQVVLGDQPWLQDHLVGVVVGYDT